KYNYINIADFISYSIETEEYELILDIIDNNINNELSDADYLGVIERIQKNNDELKIIELKEKLKNTSDINEKLKINDEIAKLKKKDV
ncbi:MAG: hypothetical protein K5666_03455, partial [Bacilli bacterium]|nr:hypothetical protein [Bacilli bacterium]